MKIQQTGLGRNLIRRLALLGVALLGSLSAVAAPAITGVTPPADRTYLGGEFLTFQVAFDEAVLVTGTPQLGLTIGSSAVNAVYEGGNGKMNLVFRYRVQPGDADSDGIAVTTPLALNSGTIKNAGGSDTTLTFTAPSTAAINVDGTQIPAPCSKPISRPTMPEQATSFVVRWRSPATPWWLGRVEKTATRRQ